MDISRSQLTRIVVAIDAAVSSNEDSDDTGIVVCARGPHINLPDKPCTIPYCPGHGYVLDDRTCHEAPHVWARIAVQAYDDHKADRIVAEVNNGGDMIGETIHAIRAGIPYSTVTATRGKRVRAEPVAALSEQNRIHFVGSFPDLEQQLITWDPELSKNSPDRLDAFVWAMTYLGLIGGASAAVMQAWAAEADFGSAAAVPKGHFDPNQAANGREAAAPCTRTDCNWQLCEEDAALEECANPDCDLFRDKETV